MMRYMHIVVKHAFFDMIKQNSSKEASLDDQLILNDQLLSLQDLDEYANVERFVLHQESNAELSSYIDKLPGKMQQIMKLKLDGFSSQEIADKLSKRPVTIRVSIMRATRLLRKIMTEEDQPHLTRHQYNSMGSYNMSPALRKSIAQLPDPYRTVVAFHGAHHMSYSEVATTLHKSVGTVKSQYYRGKNKLQSLDSRTTLQNSSDQDLDETVSTCLTHIHLLDDHLQEVIKLHYIQRLSYSEIAKKLGRPEGTIKAWISRAKGNCQQHVNIQGTTGTIKSSSRKRSNFAEDELEYIKEGGMHRGPREVMKKYYIESLSIGDIALELNMSPKEVKSKIKAGRRLVEKHARRWYETKRTSMIAS